MLDLVRLVSPFDSSAWVNGIPEGISDGGSLILATSATASRAMAWLHSLSAALDSTGEINLLLKESPLCLGENFVDMLVVEGSDEEFLLDKLSVGI